MESFLASGNVIIDDPDMELRQLEARVEDAVRGAFGFEADTFARPLEALEAITGGELLASAEEEGFTVHVVLLKAEPTADEMRALAGLETADDRFPALGREVLWLRRGRLTESSVEPRHLERALGNAPNTMRKATTLRRIVRKFGR